MPVPQIPTRLLYPRKEAAYQLGISIRALDHLKANKRLRSQRIGGRVLIHWRELQRFAGSNHYEPRDAASVSVSSPFGITSFLWGKY
jgi:hypothetical protein